MSAALNVVHEVFADDWTERLIIERLEDAGRTLIAMKDTGYRPGLAQRQHDVVHDIWDAYNWTIPPELRLPRPGIEEIKRMDEAYGWMKFIPSGQVTMRRIVQARSLRHPLSDRYLFSWRRLADVLRLDHKAVQRVHANGIRNILKGL
ncbi:MAG TPA: DUF6362 family protein [Acidocella sp.]|jgi:hypothetical protein|uniref:DUF6362 family protein n=1 Tax=Acidocella sp. TaxID=50710 RepID=UPI002C02B0F8|nr:DUF6362 family protein [Acidocella sp.]HVE20640.1 DUF6362 family protein [Acidocella sp.]